MTADERLIERLARRVELMNRKHDETGDPKYLRLSAEADRMYRAALHFFGPCVEVEPYSAGTRWGVSG